MAKLKRKLKLSSGYSTIIKTRTALEPEIALWSPVVPRAILDRRSELDDAVDGQLDLVANETYTERVVELIGLATQRSTGTGNDFYRTLQLLTNLKNSPLVELPSKAKHQIAEAARELEAVGPPTLTWAEVQKIHRTQAGIRAPRGGSQASIICNTGHMRRTLTSSWARTSSATSAAAATATRLSMATTSPFARQSSEASRSACSRRSPRTSTSTTATGSAKAIPSGCWSPKADGNWSCSC